MIFRYGVVSVDIKVKVGTTELHVGEKYIFTRQDKKKIVGTVIQLSKTMLIYEDKGVRNELRYHEVIKAKRFKDPNDDDLNISGLHAMTRRLG